MVERDLGQATIVYESPETGPVEKSVPNEHVAYVQDHWTVKIDERDGGHDVVRRIPAERVYHVERDVEAFEEEVRTIRGRIQSVADELRTKIPGGDAGEEHEPHRIDINVEEAADQGESASDDGDDAEEP